MTPLIKIKAEYDLSSFSKFNTPTFKRTLTTALNKPISSLQTQVNREIRQRVNLKASVVRRGIKLYRAHHKKFIRQTPQASLQVSPKPIPLIHYQARQTKRKGVSVNIKGRRKYLPRAFIATMRSGHRGVFQQVGKKRLPIREFYSTRLTDVVDDPKLISNIAEQAQQRFNIELGRAINLVLQKHLR